MANVAISAMTTGLEDARKMDDELAGGVTDLGTLDEALGVSPRRRTAKKTIVEVEEVEEEDEGLSVRISKA
jgi:hypothetical protein